MSPQVFMEHGFIHLRVRGRVVFRQLNAVAREREQGFSGGIFHQYARVIFQRELQGSKGEICPASVENGDCLREDSYKDKEAGLWKGSGEGLRLRRRSGC